MPAEGHVEILQTKVYDRPFISLVIFLGLFIKNKIDIFKQN